MNTKLYFNLKTNEIVREIDKDMPKQLYCEYRLSNIPDVVTEHYDVDGKIIDFSYSSSLRKYMSREMMAYKRNLFMEENLGTGYIPPRLMYIDVPSDMFDSLQCD